MNKKIGIASRFLSFFSKAETVYGIHSPFVYQLAQAVVEDTRHFYAFSMIEPIRQALLQNYHTIEVQDFGAGSHVLTDNKRKVSQIAKTSLSTVYRSRMLFRIVNFVKPLTMLELGTSLGVSALYQAAASKHGRLLTLEGSPAIAKIAQASIQSYPVKLDIDVRTGAFEYNLSTALTDLQRLDYVFLDGNHEQQATLEYFDKCLAYAHADSVFVLDDIYWSEGMQSAWEKIKAHPRVTLTADFFYLGLVFFRKEHAPKQHYRIVPSAWKPWRMGFFN